MQLVRLSQQGVIIPPIKKYPIKTITSAELCERYINYVDRKETTIKGYFTCIRRFSKWLAENGISLQSASREDMQAYRNYLRNSGLKAGTCAQYFRAAKALVHWAYCEGLISADIGDNVHGEKIRIDIHKRDALSEDAIKEIEASINRDTTDGKRLYAMLMLTTVCGFRTVELSRVNIGDVYQIGSDFWVRVWGKGHDEPDHSEFLPPEVKSAVDDYLQSRSDNWNKKSPLFIGTSNRSRPGSFKCYKTDRYGNYVLDETGEKIKVFHDGRIAPNTISTMLKKMLVNAGYDSERYTAHSLRHTCGTAAHKSGNDLYDTQHLMRHKSPQTTEIYIHTTNDIEREKKGRSAIYNYLYTDTPVKKLLPELESKIIEMTAAEQKELLNMIRERES